MHLLPSVMLIVVGGLLLTGCPPPPLSLDEPDAADNSPPGITSVRNETGVEFAIGTDPNIIIIDESSMTLQLLDSDLDDTLYVRGFFNYNLVDHDAARAVCNVGPSTPRSNERTVTCNLGSYCQDDDVPTSPHQMDILVTDRMPDDAGELVPPYFTVEPPGREARRTYVIQCQESPL